MSTIKSYITLDPGAKYEKSLDNKNAMQNRKRGSKSHVETDLRGTPRFLEIIVDETVVFDVVNVVVVSVSRSDSIK